MLDSALEGRDMMYLFIMKGGRLCRETVEQMYGLISDVTGMLGLTDMS